MSDIENYRYARCEISLEKLALTEIVAKLWKGCDIMSVVEDKSWKFYANYDEIYSTDNFKRLVEKITIKVSFFLPSKLERKAKFLIIPVGLHMCEWIDLNQIYIDLLNIEDFLNSICWNNRGFIHRSSSVDLWIKKTNRMILFERACQFCVENQINSLWLRLPEFMKVLLQDNVFRLEHYLMNYWVQERENNLCYIRQLIREILEILTIEVPDEYIFDLENINLLIIQLSLLSANSSTFKYFYSKLSESERSKNAMEYLSKVMNFEFELGGHDHQEYMEIIYFLHPQMSLDDRKFILHHYGNSYLYFTSIFWKYQNQIIQTIAILGNDLTIRMYCCVLVKVAQLMIEGRYVEEGLIEDVWYATSESFKKDLLRHVSNQTEFLLMFEGNVVELNELILTETTTVERNELYSFFEL